ncbi:2-dehydropantoate 2-reductase [Desulfuromonas carbonis]|uniref:ketopantoate reductase family protein n=1 Tax=Desulfuromonas sp. DDH964 TaxID=1823759 RepID=UPI00078B917C|nr:2-dehydropantoate 2-reductase [Desulfuromonas sp. DDH964]AMV71620.1 2-dehydropantoate 2-reductase [Desulfuromonas sp. DDH964]
MDEIRKIAILGAGALGAYYASRFHAAGFETLFVAAGERGESLRREGCNVNGENFRLPVMAGDTSPAPVDLVIVALKHHQLAEALPGLRPVVGPQTTILSVLNGLDSEAVIGSVFGAEKLLFCVAVGIDAVREGKMITVANQGRLLFGEAHNEPPSLRVQRLQAACDRAGLAWETPVDMLRALWWKFMVNVGVNQASAVLRAPYGIFQRSDSAREVLRALMLEVIALAGAAGVDLTTADLGEWERVLARLAPEAKTSMLQDVEAGRKTEVEIFAGKVVELGLRYGIPTPANRMMLYLLRVIETSPELLLPPRAV